MRERILSDSLYLDSVTNLASLRFDQALKLEPSNEKKAEDIYLKIKRRDSTDYWGLQAATRLRYLKASKVKKEFIQKLSGHWDWNWKGTNWGDIETPKKGTLERKLIIQENGELEFHENGKLVSKDTYKIKLRDKNGRNEYLLELNSNKELFSLWYNKTRLTLSQPDCGCGCLTNEYSRKWKKGI